MKLGNKYKLRIISSNALNVYKAVVDCFTFLHSVPLNPADSKRLKAAEKRLHEIEKSVDFAQRYRLTNNVLYRDLYGILSDIAPEGCYFSTHPGEPSLIGLWEKSHYVYVSMRRIIQAVDLHSRYLLRNYGLTGPQLFILQEMAKHKEISIGEVAKAISLGQATVTGILTRLENRGLVVRRRGNSDKRRVFVRITKDCEQLLKSAPPPIQETFMDQFNNLLDWEQTLILSALQRIVSMMDAKTLKASPILTTGPIDNTANQIKE